ncbi:MAG: hypothetical protein AB1679_14405 [Actinomycetota bacterium]
MTTTEASRAASREGAVEVPFPSVAWFERLGELMAEQRPRFEHLGTIDCVMQVTIVDGGPGGEPWKTQVTFEEFALTDVRLVGDDDLARADFVVETDLATWREMVENIVAGEGRPDLAHTLNYLSLPGTPIRVWSEDPLRRDAFFRFNQTLQEFIDNCGSFTTRFGEG